jgi:hydrocephalus-inducing protein
MPPKPQGPFIVKANSSTTILFKNIFSYPLGYSFTIDNSLFHVNKSNELVKPHQTYKIVVSFDGNESSTKADVMGKLVVSAARSAGSKNLEWIYYIKGVSM